MLALLPLLAGSIEDSGTHDGHSNSFKAGLPPVLQTLFVLGSVVLVIILGRYIVPPLMRVVSKTNQRELFPAFALLLVFFTTFIMGLAGLSPALGAFLAGVVLANSPYRHQLEVDLEPVKGLLLGLFFMAVGASIDFSVLANYPVLVPILVFCLLLLKSIILFVLGKYFRMGTDQNILFSIGLSQTGEFAFVLLSYIGQLALLEQSVIDVTLVVVAISMASTPLLMVLVEKYILPNIGTKRAVKSRDSDEIHTKGSVIIAGFGRFGAIAGRFLRANGVNTVILDNDSDRVELLREIGFEVYYGDATSIDLLEVAGAEEAKAILIGLPTPQQNLDLVRSVKKHFPDLHIIVRSFDYQDTYELMDEGVMHIFRDVIQNGVSAASEILKLLGYRTYAVNRNAKRFLLHDDKTLKSLASVRENKKEYINTIRNVIAELENQIKSDILTDAPMRDIGWDSQSLRKTAKADAKTKATIER
jgi:CPA2 family monovalent cation:H+ antiporter-2/glutathione-regulated potassium-efflux system protein KefB